MKKNQIIKYLDFLHILQKCLTKRSFIGYKKSGNYIIELKIRKKFLTSSELGYKCRAPKVKVLNKHINDLYGLNYEIGNTHEIEDFDTDKFNECTHGIHFYMNEEDSK